MASDRTNYFLQMEAIDELRDRLAVIADEAEKLVLGLTDSRRYSENISELFRHFHSIKALAAFLELENVKKSVAVIEDILAILRQKKPPIRQEIIDWLLQVCDQVAVWHDKIEAGSVEFEPIDAYTLNMVKSTVVISKRPDEILKELSVLHYTQDRESLNFVQKALKNSVKKVVGVQTAQDAIKLIQSSKIDILLISELAEEPETVKLLAELKSLERCNVQVLIAASSKISEKAQKEYLRIGVELFVADFMRFDTLLQKLQMVAKLYFEEKSIKLSVSPIFRKISYLKPLPTTVSEIQRLKTDPNATIRDLTNIVAKDPIASAKIIKLVNSPAYGFRSEVSSLHHAISLLGKEKVIALTLQSGVESSVKIELDPYGISQEIFFGTSYLRMNFMMNWFPKVNLSKSAMMVTAALLSNIGQILIADEVKRRGVGEKFLSVIKSTENQAFAEMEFCNTTSQDVTADMLEHWGMEEDLVQVIRYSFDFASAPDDIKPLAIALYVTNELIPGLVGKFVQERIDETKDLLIEMNFNPEHYTNAIEKSLFKK